MMTTSTPKDMTSIYGLVMFLLLGIAPSIAQRVTMHPAHNRPIPQRPA